MSRIRWGTCQSAPKQQSTEENVNLLVSLRLEILCRRQTGDRSNGGGVAGEARSLKFSRCRLCRWYFLHSIPCEPRRCYGRGYLHLGCPIRKPYHTWLKRALPSLIRLACVRTQHRCQMLLQMTCILAKSLDFGCEAGLGKLHKQRFPAASARCRNVRARCGQQ
jgi:hypothetical protein